MGLTIHYNGRFKDFNKLKDMIDEVEDVAKLNGWDYHTFEDEFEENNFKNNIVNGNLYGISLSPPGSEPVEFTFSSNGRLCSIHELKSGSKTSYTIFSKTQYAGAEVHKIIIDLMRYISGKYFSEFKMIDESHYWETNDENILKENFNRYNNMMNDFADVLENIPVYENESTEAFINRLSKHLRTKGKK